MFYTTNYKSKDDLFTGKLPYRLTNDYLFRAVFQTRPKALEGLCRAVLRLKPEDTLSVTLQNPIELGTRIDNKEFVLDLAVIINNVLFLNLEMQVYHEAFWKERSLSYACRSFDQLNHGENYNKVLPVVHVGFLNYSLFPEYPEFFATYELAHTSSPNYSYLYSDKLRISVVDLTQIELATEDDKNHDIDLWARVFTATTWEEIEMLAQNNEYLKEAVSGVRQLTEDEKIRQQCQAREDFEYWERIRNNYTKELGENLKLTQGKLEQAQGQLEQTQDELAKALARIAELEGKN